MLRQQQIHETRRLLLEAASDLLELDAMSREGRACEAARVATRVRALTEAAQRCLHRLDDDRERRTE